MRLTKVEIAEYKYRLAVTGSATFKNYDLFDLYLNKYLTVKFGRKWKSLNLGIITGSNRDGPDIFIGSWCTLNSVPWTSIEIEWRNIDAPGALVRRNKWGQAVNRNAGIQRNKEIARLSTHMCLFWDMVSHDIGDLLASVVEQNLDCIIFNTNKLTDDYEGEKPDRNYKRPERHFSREDQNANIQDDGERTVREELSSNGRNRPSFGYNKFLDSVWSRKK